MKSYLFGSKKNQPVDKTPNPSSGGNGIFGIVTSKIATTNRNKAGNQSASTPANGSNQLLMSADAMAQPTNFNTATPD